MKIAKGIYIKPDTERLLEGRTPKLAPKQVDQVEDVNFKGSKEHHRLSFQYNKELEENVAQVIDTRTGQAVRDLPSATQVDHKIRLRRLMGLHLDRKA